MTRGPWKYGIISLLVLGDITCYYISLKIIGVDILSARQSPWILGFLTGAVISFALSGCYSHKGIVSRVDEAIQVVKALVVLTMLVIFIGIVTETSIYLVT